MAPLGSVGSTRNGTTTVSLAIARSTSRSTCREVFALLENTTTMSRLSWIAPTMDSLQMSPGTTSRGAIQQRTPACSSRATTASATGLSCVL